MKIGLPIISFLFEKKTSAHIVLIAGLMGFYTSHSYAQTTPLFSNDAASIMAMTPVQKDALPELKPAEAVISKPSSGPLKVVIPNIKPVAETETKAVYKKRRYSKRPTSQVLASLPETGEMPILLSDENNNGVMIDAAISAATPFTQNAVAILSALPSDWIMHSSTQPVATIIQAETLAEKPVTAAKVEQQIATIIPNPIIPKASALAPQDDVFMLAQMTPAAGDSTPSANNGNIVPLIATPTARATREEAPVIITPAPAAVSPIAAEPITAPEPAIIAPSPAAAQSTIEPIKPVVPATELPLPPVVKKETPAVFEPSTQDPTEPSPTLSTQSKAILDKLPKMSGKKEIPQKGTVHIGRESPTPEFGESFQASSHESKGMKVDVQPRKVDVSYELEKAYNALVAGRSEIAIQLYGDVLTNDPKNKDALFGLASTYHRVGQLDLARSLYGKLLDIDPKNRDGLNNFLVLLAEEAPQEALTKMEQMEQENPGFSPIPAQMAVIYKKLGNHEKAVDKMYQALSLSPENTTYRYNLAVMLDRAGHYDRAATLYKQLINASEQGELIPGDVRKIQQRLTFIRSNSHR